MTPRCLMPCAALLLLMLPSVAAADSATEPATEPTAEPTPEPGPPAGTYRNDPVHTRLIFSVNHLGFSEYPAFFRKIDATLQFDPDHPEAMSLEAHIDAASVETLYVEPALDFNAVVAGESLLDAAKYPDISFKSTRIRLTAPHEAAVTGDFTLHGVTRPLTLHVRYNGGYAGNPLDPGGARIGFSADGALFRSDFGIGFGIPAPGSTMGVGDLVSFRIETELQNPDAPGVQTGP